MAEGEHPQPASCEEILAEEPEVQELPAEVAAVTAEETGSVEGQQRTPTQQEAEAKRGHPRVEALKHSQNPSAARVLSSFGSHSVTSDSDDLSFEDEDEDEEESSSDSRPWAMCDERPLFPQDDPAEKAETDLIRLLGGNLTPPVAKPEAGRQPGSPAAVRMSIPKLQLISPPPVHFEKPVVAPALSATSTTGSESDVSAGLSASAGTPTSASLATSSSKAKCAAVQVAIPPTSPATPTSPPPPSESPVPAFPPTSPTAAAQHAVSGTCSDGSKDSNAAKEAHTQVEREETIREEQEMASIEQQQVCPSREAAPADNQSVKSVLSSESEDIDGAKEGEAEVTEAAETEKEMQQAEVPVPEEEKPFEKMQDKVAQGEEEEQREEKVQQASEEEAEQVQRETEGEEEGTQHEKEQLLEETEEKATEEMRGEADRREEETREQSEGKSEEEDQQSEERSLEPEKEAETENREEQQQDEGELIASGGEQVEQVTEDEAAAAEGELVEKEKQSEDEVEEQYGTMDVREIGASKEAEAKPKDLQAVEVETAEVGRELTESEEELLGEVEVHMRQPMAEVSESVEKEEIVEFPKEENGKDIEITDEVEEKSSKHQAGEEMEREMLENEEAALERPATEVIESAGKKYEEKPHSQELEEAGEAEGELIASEEEKEGVKLERESEEKRRVEEGEAVGEVVGEEQECTQSEEEAEQRLQVLAENVKGDLIDNERKQTAEERKEPEEEEVTEEDEENDQNEGKEEVREFSDASEVSEPGDSGAEKEAKPKGKPLEAVLESEEEAKEQVSEEEQASEVEEDEAVEEVKKSEVQPPEEAEAESIEGEELLKEKQQEAEVEGEENAENEGRQGSEEELEEDSGGENEGEGDREHELQKLEQVESDIGDDTFDQTPVKMPPVDGAVHSPAVQVKKVGEPNEAPPANNVKAEVKAKLVTAKLQAPVQRRKKAAAVHLPQLAETLEEVKRSLAELAAEERAGKGNVAPVSPGSLKEMQTLVAPNMSQRLSRQREENLRKIQRRRAFDERKKWSLEEITAVSKTAEITTKSNEFQRWGKEEFTRRLADIKVDDTRAKVVPLYSFGLGGGGVPKRLTLSDMTHLPSKHVMSSGYGSARYVPAHAPRDTKRASPTATTATRLSSRATESSLQGAKNKTALSRRPSLPVPKSTAKPASRKATDVPVPAKSAAAAPHSSQLSRPGEPQSHLPRPSRDRFCQKAPALGDGNARKSLLRPPTATRTAPVKAPAQAPTRTNVPAQAPRLSEKAKPAKTAQSPYAVKPPRATTAPAQPHQPKVKAKAAKAGTCRACDEAHTQRGTPHNSAAEFAALEDWSEEEGVERAATAESNVTAANEEALQEEKGGHTTADELEVSSPTSLSATDDEAKDVLEGEGEETGQQAQE
eukprot:TRINITY_DN529_c1_g1_i1.p1 TRINITY_DN529_c1_g1~~TRINITY_DN529_c1_g1_i1.p1  ORF type:complete len:1647 (+),score=507.93 TRINITY_DN529_c1_g1_i1:736-4941(+)